MIILSIPIPTLFYATFFYYCIPQINYLFEYEILSRRYKEKLKNHRGLN